MRTKPTKTAWNEQGWFDSAKAWIFDTLDRKGLRVTGEVENLRQRPWSIVLSVPTNQGRVYFKASAPFLSNEPALTQALYRWRPDCMVQVLAVNLESSWMLMSDEGVILRNFIQSPEDLRHWETLLPLFAEIQIEMADRQQDLLELGIMDRRLSILPAMFDQMLQDYEAMRLDREDGLSLVKHHQLQDFVPRFTEMCEQLNASAIPLSLHHDDFHDGNVYVSDGRYTFSDWGESCLTHPFFSMVINLRSTADQLNLPDEITESPERFTPQINRLRDLYLEPWTRYESPQALREIFSIAWRVGMINRALTWYHVLLHSDEPVRESYGYTVPAWLKEFLLTI